MQYITFNEETDFSIAILAYDLDYPGMLKNYAEDGLIKSGASPEIIKELIAYKLPFTLNANGKKRKALPVAERREVLSELLAIFQNIGIKHIIVANPDYYKTLTGSAKAALEVGSLSPPDAAHFEEYSDMKVAFVPNYKMAFYDPEKTAHGIKTSMDAIVADRTGGYQDPGSSIIQSCFYPQSIAEIREALDTLLYMGALAIDIEGFSLQHHDAGIASIAFAWDENNGVAFQVDYAPEFPNRIVRLMLIDFFRLRHEHFRNTTEDVRHIFHNAGYDVPVLVYQLAQDLKLPLKQDEPLERMFDWLCQEETLDDTKIISYLATNSTAGNKLGLKDQAVEFAANYAVDEIKDVTKIPVRELLEYNLVDVLSTWFVYNKHHPKMCQDNQGKVYRDLFMPALIDIIDMQLNGLPVDMRQVAQSKSALQNINDSAMFVIQSHPAVLEYTHHLKELEVAKRNAKLKKKQITTADVTLTFNPNSDIQLAGLLYSNDFLGLPVLGHTASGAPSTKGKYISALKNHTKDQAILDFLDAVIELKDSGILLSTFIPALENARRAPDGYYYMHGNFNLGGTVSGRLSSSDPNLQNIPSKSRLAKYIKRCIKAPPGWLFVGLDFDSLEDKISALITKDPNKLKVYTDGYDGHCLRAFSYFGDQMPDIDGSSVESINSIAVKYPNERQTSKTPTFLLTYGGTYHGLMSNCGFDEKTAIKIDTNYHTLYRVSDEWVASQLEGARKNGYIEVAFGLRVRTPILHQTVDTQRHTPWAAKAEGRTAGNALGQSWGLLNNRAASQFMDSVRRDPEMRRKVKICCQIHDAQYYLIRQDVKTLKWFNDHLTKCVKWQNHPAIAHDKVKLSGEVSIFFPSWAEEYPIPNDASILELEDIGVKIMKDFNDAK